MKDVATRKQLMGLVDIGDQILEINGDVVSKLSMLAVNNAIAQNKVRLKILPFMYIPNM